MLENVTCNGNKFLAEQEWHSGWSTRLPPVWPGFESRTQLHYVGSRPALKVFLQVLRFTSLQKMERSQIPIRSEQAATQAFRFKYDWNSKEINLCFLDWTSSACKKRGYPWRWGSGGNYTLPWSGCKIGNFSKTVLKMSATFGQLFRFLKIQFFLSKTIPQIRTNQTGILNTKFLQSFFFSLFGHNCHL